MMLRPGMEFLVCSNSKTAQIINWFQKVHSVDNESTYNHGGIIVDPNGMTFEALRKITYGTLDTYKGCALLIVRHKMMTMERFNDAWPEIQELNGCIYPYPRLLLHALRVAKFIHWKYPVCSELVAKFECDAGLRRQWWGINPDNLADEWRISKYYDVIFEGEWK